MKVVIVEDEELVARNLEKLLQQIDESIEVVKLLDSVEGTVNWIQQNTPPDLYFMDIQLSDGVSFDIFKRLDIRQPIVFTTAYDEYALKAFKVNSIDYLLKPIDKSDLKRAIDKYHQLSGLSGVSSKERIGVFMEDVAALRKDHFKERFLAHYKSGIVPLPEARIACFLKDTLIYLITDDNEKLVTDYSTIDEIEEVVNPGKFYRANRQTIIHINQIDNYKRLDTGKIELHLKCDKNLKVDVSREKASNFIAWIDK